MGHAPQGKVLTTWESPWWQEISLEGELQSHRGEHSNFATGKTEVTCTVSTATLCSPAWDAHLHHLGFWRSVPGRGLGLAAQRPPEGTGVWQLRVYVERTWAHKRGKNPLLWGGGGACRGKDARSGAGTTTGASFPAHALKQQVTAYRSSGVAGASRHYHPGLQRQVWATAAAERKGSRHSSLPLSGMGPGNTHELHTLKKEAASIKTKNPLNKNIKPTQTTQGCSCI